MTAGVFVLRVNQLVEVALCSACGLVLVDKFEAVIVELLKEFVPGDLLQVFVVTISGIGEAESEDASLVTLVGAADFRRLSATRICPLANCVVILGRLGKCHCWTSR